MKTYTLEDSLLRKVTMSYALVADCPWRLCLHSTPKPPEAVKYKSVCTNFPSESVFRIIIRSFLLLTLLILVEGKALLYTDLPCN